MRPIRSHLFIMSKKKRKKQSGDELQFFKDLGGDELVADVKAYEQLLKTYAKQKRTDESWQSIGIVQGFEAYEGGVRIYGEYAIVDILWITDYTLRVWVRADKDFNDPFSYAVVDKSRNVIRYELLSRDDTIEMRSSQLKCVIHKNPYHLELAHLDDRIVSKDVIGPEMGSAGSVRLSKPLCVDEDSYGLAERATGLNLRGQRFAFWNRDAPNCDRGSDPLYYNVPFYLGLHGQGSYGVFFDNSYRGWVDAGNEDPNTLTFEFEGGDLRYYLIAAEHPKTVMSQYADLTGHIPLPPLWYLGFHQSRFSYFSEGEVVDIADQLREHGIPCDALYLDIHYMERFKVFTWNGETFSNLSQMNDQLHRRGFHVVPIIDPGIKVEADYSVYESGLEQDVFLKGQDDKPLRVVVWPGACHLPDFSLSKAREWWAEQAATFIRTGIDGIWNDMNEPAVFTSEGADTLPDSILHDGDGHGGAHVEYHNLYGTLMGRASYESLEAHRPHKRQVNIIRAGFAGAQRHSSSWTGDVSSDWDHLRMSIPMVLNMGLSGAPLTGPDVGGFRGDTDAELLTRWTQAACLMPYYRNHSAIDTVRQEPWVFGEPYLSIMRHAIELRYQLMGYLYSVVAESHAYGVPIIRPMFMYDPQDADLRDIDDQYLLGDLLLVAPVVEEGVTQRTVILPNGDWYDFWTNHHYQGGQVITVDAPLSHLPLFVRGGAVLPIWDVVQNLFNGTPKQNTLRLRVYPGQADTVLYEDAGEGLSYQQGDSRWIYISTSWVNNRLRVQRRIAGNREPHYSKIQIEVVGFDEEPLKVSVDRQGAPVWYYEGGLVELKVDDFELLEITRQIGPQDETIINRPW